MDTYQNTLIWMSQFGRPDTLRRHRRMGRLGRGLRRLGRVATGLALTAVLLARIHCEEEDR